MKGKAVIIGLSITLTIVLLIYFIRSNNNSNKFQWYQSFAFDSNQPYGTMFIQKMLATYYDGELTINQKEPIHKVLEGDKFTDGNTNYILIGQNIHLDYNDVRALEEFVANGNDVFIATLEPPKALIDTIFYSDCEAEFLYEYNLDTTVYANFYGETLNKTADYEFRYRIGAEDYPFFWRSLDPQVMCDSIANIQSLGYQQAGEVNFMEIKYGEGSVFLHTSPLMFTNYFMTKKDKVEYASAVFSHLSGENTIWDEVSKIPFSDLQNPYESPLYYILQQPALKYAWWMLLVGAALYIIFASKRTQRIIPVLEAKTNTSLEFLNVISSLHYQNPNHLDMARKKMKYFLYFIRAKYGVNTQSLTEEQAKRLAEKSKVDLADIQTIIDRYRVIENYSISTDEPERLVGLYQAIEKFYKNCK